MPKILEKQTLAPNVTRYVVSVPKIARKRKAGQFVLVCPTPNGERIPLTIADADADAGTITLVVQTVGKTTAEMAMMAAGEEFTDVSGPLGMPTHIDKVGTVVCVGGGIGIAPLHPIAQAFKEAGNEVITIIGARNNDLVIMQDDMAKISDELIVCTDDGSKGVKGFVTNVLQEIIDSGRTLNEVIAIGPPIMMKMVAEVTRPYEIKTLVSLNPIMVDGTGMCGGCRVEVGGVNKFACVDGPEFDGHAVNFDLLMARQRTYTEQETKALKKFEDHHQCRIRKN